MSEFILKARDLNKFYTQRSGRFGFGTTQIKALDNVSIELRHASTLAVVGESGSGKSTLARCLLQLQPLDGGSVFFQGRDLAELPANELRKQRRHLQMIFQDPYSSLNPRHTIGSIIASSYEIHGIHPEGGVKKAVQNLLDRVGLNPEHINRFPHEFSGGQRQRIGIARALALRPKLIIADEPVSALDVSIQAQVVNLLDDLQKEMGLSYLFIAHDLSVVQHISDRVIVMYLGKIMEEAKTSQLFLNPRHPYTKALLSAVPIPDPEIERNRERIVLSGDLPSPANPPSGCVFSTRCWKATEKCHQIAPPLVEISIGSKVACHFPEGN